MLSYMVIWYKRKMYVTSIAVLIFVCLILLLTTITKFSFISKINNSQIMLQGGFSHNIIYSGDRQYDVIATELWSPLLPNNLM